MNVEEFDQRSQALGHAIQTGIAFEMEKDPHSTEPKHLRVGVNLAMCQHTGLFRALLAKGVLTEAEYFDGVIQTLEEEKARYVRRLNELYGATNIDLG